MEYNYELPYRESTYNMESAIHRTLLPYHKITFNFFWHYHYSHDQDSPPYRTDHTYTCLKFQGPLSHEDVRRIVTDAIGYHLDDGQRAFFVDHDLMRVVRHYFPADEAPPKHTSCTIDVDIWNWDSYTAESHDNDLPAAGIMVPAADSSLEMLDKYEVDYDQESCRCCICLEEDVGRGGRAGLRMPCSHVFHDGCIKEWLRTSHYCPMCRYEMPTQ